MLGITDEAGLRGPVRRHALRVRARAAPRGRRPQPPSEASRTCGAGRPSWQSTLAREDAPDGSRVRLAARAGRAGCAAATSPTRAATWRSRRAAGRRAPGRRASRLRAGRARARWSARRRGDPARADAPAVATRLARRASRRRPRAVADAAAGLATRPAPRAPSSAAPGDYKPVHRRRRASSIASAICALEDRLAERAGRAPRRRGRSPDRSRRGRPGRRPAARRSAPSRRARSARRARRGRSPSSRAGPGTGKTALIDGIVRALARRGSRADAIAIAAPTGKAANRIAELPCGDAAPSARTLHRLLGSAGPARRRARR